VWVWPPIFYDEAGRRGARPATRFVAMAQAGLTSYAPGTPDAIRSDDPGVLAESSHWNLLMGDLARARATYIIDTAPAGIYRWERDPLNEQPQLERYVASRYERLDTISRVDVYKLVGCED